LEGVGPGADFMRPLQLVLPTTVQQWAPRKAPSRRDHPAKPGTGECPKISLNPKREPGDAFLNRGGRRGRGKVRGKDDDGRIIPNLIAVTVRENDESIEIPAVGFNRMLKKSEITDFFLFMNEPHKKKPYF
jgi:hypothetical protein